MLTNRIDEAEYNRLFEKLVPDSGACETLQGELLRAASRIMHDYTNNGFGNNWSGALAFLDAHLPGGVRPTEFKLLRPYSKGKIFHGDYDEYDPMLFVCENLVIRAVKAAWQADIEGKFDPLPCDMFSLQVRR